MERRERAGSRICAARSTGVTGMPQVRGTIRIGTSGWQYRHWVGPFYPEKTTTARMLHTYGQYFATTEINSTFYRLAGLTAVASWRDETPPGFVFACKANRYITHMKKLKDPAKSLAAFFAIVDALGDKGGPVLFQLPPRWQANPGRLAEFLAHLPAGGRHVFEFRDPSWWTDEVMTLLHDQGAGFCIFDLAGTATDPTVTADFAYVRLHGPGAAYHGNYTDDALRRWAARIDEWAADGLDVYVYFDNDADAHAPRNATTLKAMVQEKDRVSDPSQRRLAG